MIEKRLYSLFEMRDGKWVRLTSIALKKSQAVRFFQNSLLSGFFAGVKRELRVVPKTPDAWGNPQ